MCKKAVFNGKYRRKGHAFYLNTTIKLPQQAESELEQFSVDISKDDGDPARYFLEYREVYNRAHDVFHIVVFDLVEIDSACEVRD